MNHNRVFTLAALLPVAAAAQNVPDTAKQPARPVNIIHIMADDHSFQTIGAYGHPVSRVAPTPNIDRLANEGMLFTHAYVENSISAPSRATLLTGKYSHQHGQRTLTRGFDTEQICFPELLQSAGYQTAVVGKWHLDAEPRGFDHYCILNDQGHYYNPQFRTPDSEGKYVREEGYATTLITDHALGWLESRDTDKPFCLLLHHKAPHRNWMPEGQYLGLFEDTHIPEPATLFDDYTTRCPAAASQEMTIANHMSMAYDLKVDQLNETDPPARQRDWNSSLGRMTSDQLATWKAAYDPSNEEMIALNLTGDDLTRWKYQRYMKDYLRVIHSIDEQVGRVLDWLDANGLAENTIVVYTSDQGFYMGEHGWYDKRFMYEESFRTPLLVRLPGTTHPGSVCADLVQNIDFAPTYLALAGVEVLKDMEGVPLGPVLAGNTPADWRDILYYQYYDYPAVHMVRKHYGVRTKDYKLIHFYGEGGGKDEGRVIDCWEFYDLRGDSSETRNLYGNPAYAEIIEQMTQRLECIRGGLGNPL